VRLLERAREPVFDPVLDDRIDVGVAEIGEREGDALELVALGGAP